MHCMCVDRARGITCSPPPPQLILFPPLPLDFFSFISLCLLCSHLPSSSLVSPAVFQLVGYSRPNQSHISVCFSQQLFCVKGRQGHLQPPCSIPRGCSVHMCCLLCRSLLCAGGPFPLTEEAGLLPHSDLHPTNHGCGAVTSLFLDQQGVCPCTHSRWYAPPT